MLESWDYPSSVSPFGICAYIANRAGSGSPHDTSQIPWREKESFILTARHSLTFRGTARSFHSAATPPLSRDRHRKEPRAAPTPQRAPRAGTAPHTRPGSNAATGTKPSLLAATGPRAAPAALSWLKQPRAAARSRPGPTTRTRTRLARRCLSKAQNGGRPPRFWRGRACAEPGRAEKAGGERRPPEGRGAHLRRDGGGKRQAVAFNHRKIWEIALP